MSAHGSTTRRAGRSTLAIAALTIAVAVTPRVVGAQVEPGRFSVVTRLGMHAPERAASQDRAALLGLDTEYAVNRWFGIGTNVDVARGQSTKQDFVTRLRFGNQAVAGGDSIYYQYVGQPVNTINLGLTGVARLPAARFSPFVMGGVGTYLMVLDAQINGGETRRNDLSYTVGAGVTVRLSDRAGLQFDARSVTFRGFDRDFLNPARGRAELRNPFPEDFPAPPPAKPTARSMQLTFGFRYVPGAAGGN